MPNLSARMSKTVEDPDEQELREIEAKIKEVMGLMTERHHREIVDEQLQDARNRRDQHTGDRQGVYHITPTHHIATDLHTSANLHLAEKLKIRIQLGKYALDLNDTLHRLTERQVEVLERILARSRY